MKTIANEITIQPNVIRKKLIIFLIRVFSFITLRLMIYKLENPEIAVNTKPMLRKSMLKISVNPKTFERTNGQAIVRARNVKRNAMTSVFFKLYIPHII